MANPPVCRIMDYGKYRYEQRKKAAESRKKATRVVVKEVKLGSQTDEHDVNSATWSVGARRGQGRLVRRAQWPP